LRLSSSSMLRQECREAVTTRRESVVRTGGAPNLGREPDPRLIFHKDENKRSLSHMPRQNRVTPFGEIIACPERGTFMGNRGVLHDEQGGIRRDWQVRRWLICVLEFRGRHRTIMA